MNGSNIECCQRAAGKTHTHTNTHAYSYWTSARTESRFVVVWKL